MTESRAERFVRELQQLKIPDPAVGRSGLWLRTGVTLMVAGPLVAVLAYFLSHGTTDALTQRDAITLALGGVAASVVGSALFLRYSLTNFLRFWLARQSYDLDELGNRVLGPELRYDGAASAPR
ncbi:hypothetical protein [Nocardia implantans]|uniref:Uncharacterized protein n=1 Tax=Nocardia implantans TaxID=3108168 RepID=A0ABU6ARV6_9NOCA|nr:MULTISPECIES: hypothetical protein [unclassified Nocardia]MBF6191658.1 hypothetical protein [Nocardia beijingensis]MEA3528035.1 hypothetical protein [Nocardia sp. CDC192]MEB3510213.1 hypothetical protein [Nocardia sp. CDC186]